MFFFFSVFPNSLLSSLFRLLWSMLSCWHQALSLCLRWASNRCLEAPGGRSEAYGEVGFLSQGMSNGHLLVTGELPKIKVLRVGGGGQPISLETKLPSLSELGCACWLTGHHLIYVLSVKSGITRPDPPLFPTPSIFFLLKERFHVVHVGLKLYRQLRQPSRIMGVHHHAWQSQIFLNKFLVSPGRNRILSGQRATT